MTLDPPTSCGRAASPIASTLAGLAVALAWRDHVLLAHGLLPALLCWIHLKDKPSHLAVSLLPHKEALWLFLRGPSGVSRVLRNSSSVLRCSGRSTYQLVGFCCHSHCEHTQASAVGRVFWCLPGAQMAPHLS